MDIVVGSSNTATKLTSAKMGSHTWGATDRTQSVDGRCAVMDSLRRVTVR